MFKLTKCSLIALFSLFTVLTYAQTNPAITKWLINRTGRTGFAGIKTNVQQVQYSTNNVYVTTTNIPDWIPLGYDWPNNPWSPQDQNFVFKITLNPVKKTAPLVQTPFGHIGIWTNGVSIYNPKDAKSYLDSGKWYQNAIYFEHLQIETMDSCLGHPNNKFEYHLHVHPKCLWNEQDSSRHAPLVGFAFDGFPIYGCYGYTNTNGTGAIKRLKSSYRLRNIADRTSLPDGTVLTSRYYGPTLAVYPLGAYMEDYEYVQGLGDLDEFNGRFCVTPDYPQGTYAYFVTLDAQLEPAFPYVLGPNFYGVVQVGNTGPNSGKNVISEPVNVYTSTNFINNSIEFLVYPNPAKNNVNVYLSPSFNKNMSATIYDVFGRALKTVNNIQTGVNYNIDVNDLPNGNYVLQINSDLGKTNKKLIITH
jgi:hypothetical protein